MPTLSSISINKRKTLKLHEFSANFQRLHFQIADFFIQRRPLYNSAILSANLHRITLRILISSQIKKQTFQQYKEIATRSVVKLGDFHFLSVASLSMAIHQLPLSKKQKTNQPQMPSNMPNSERYAIRSAERSTVNRSLLPLEPQIKRYQWNGISNNPAIKRCMNGR